MYVCKAIIIQSKAKVNTKSFDSQALTKKHAKTNSRGGCYVQ